MVIIVLRDFQCSKASVNERFQINIDCGTCVTRQEEEYYYSEARGSCFRLDKTTCSNQLLGTSTVETTFINVTCPTQSTATVKPECITQQGENYYYSEASSSCYKLNKTTCVNAVLGTNTTKTTLVNVTCPTPKFKTKKAGSFVHHFSN